MDRNPSFPKYFWIPLAPFRPAKARVAPLIFGTVRPGTHLLQKNSTFLVFPSFDKFVMFLLNSFVPDGFLGMIC